MGCSSSSPDTHHKEGSQRDFQFSYHPQPPKGLLLEKHTVDHVYDGDTLTIENRISVRFWGIDAPEISENEPYAKESRDYCRKLCPRGGTVLLGFSEKNERHDKYGRTLAYVYVSHPSKSGYICVNMALVEMGLARLYKLRRVKDENTNAMRDAQKKARREKRKIWKKVNEDNIVVITRNGEAFHRVGASCVVNASKVTVGEALDQLYAPCRTCKPLA
ncbi:micrococcal nuclease [Trypanosoma theileri]|uniref:Micrococcal nuclease n=1 Tax=Trypanosoma theileri TaxID=67003 RepID=A0A1X0NKT8_9TRYP|nr:micrococcal nuclease [Trypanosoma theileri]ORC85345.1 micrococcal nuclease [Trypanosoma theileri]